MAFDKPRNQSDPERELFEEAAEFGIRCGLTFPIHDHRGEIAALSFATDERRPNFVRSIIEQAENLRLVAMFFHAHARRLSTANRREFQCLEWSSRGKSAREIGIIVGISRRTAGFHLDNVRAKLGVRSLRQAEALSAEANSRK